MSVSRAALLDWLAKGPFAIAASALQGGMNYAIVLYLTFGAGLAATGEYRTLFSCYSLMALACLLESNKVFIRSVIAEDRASTSAIFWNRVVFAWGAFAIVLAVFCAGVVLGRGWLSPAIVAIAFVAAVVYPFDLYVAYLQALRRFSLLFVVEAARYGSALLVFVLMVESGRTIGEAVVAQLVVLGAFMMGSFLAFLRPWVRRERLRTAVTAPAAHQARVYSFANMLPASLEHVDKLLVGWVFGLEFLGVYTLAYSTGRFLYNILKPAMYVYYRRFVDAMPGWRLLRRVSLAFTALGVVMAAAFLFAVEAVPVMARFESGRWATAILFAAYGVGILHAVYSQAFVLNKASVAGHALRANVLATTASLLLLGLALSMPAAVALVLLALQYPLRDGLSVLLMDRLRRSGS